MKEYDELLKEYMFEPYDMYSLSPKWGDKVKAEEYLQKYWLPSDEMKVYGNLYKIKWFNQPQIFPSNKIINK